MNNWLNKLSKKQKETLGKTLIITGVIFLILIAIHLLFIIPAIILLLFAGCIYKTINKDSIENNHEKNSLDNSKMETEKNTYNDLKSNSFEIDENTSNFDCSLMLMALNQIIENKYYNPNDFTFDIYKKIDEIEKYGREKFLNSKYKDFVSVDLETTGLSFETDRIIQIAAVKVVNGEIVDIYKNLINPKKHIPIEASRINGIYDSDIKNAETIDKILPEFKEFIGNNTLVMHNENFDLSFLKAESIRVYNDNIIKNKHICTLQLWKTQFKEKQGVYPPSSKLSTLVENLLSKEEIKDFYSNQHTASGDAIATAKVFMKLFGK